MLTRLFSRAAVAGCVTWIIGAAAFAEEIGYYRWPALHGDVLIFASEGDLWRASRNGGTAFRLTTHPEEESHPAISPDGNLLAFNAHYDGAKEVYVMPLSGGAPRQVTFEGGGTAVRGWTPDGKVLFRSSNVPGTRARLLRTVDISGRKVNTLPLMDANLGTFDDDGRTLFFTRFGLSLSRDNAILYRGGRMDQLWRYELESDAEAIRLAEDFGAPIRHPMWWNGQIYFISDKSGADNIWSLDEIGGDARQLTSFADWQLKNPRLADGEIVYQRGADLFRYDVGSGEETKIDLTLVSDRDHRRVRWLEEPMLYLESSRMGAQGESVAITARGRVAAASPGDRRRVEVDVPSEARARAAVVGANGEWVYLILDQELAGDIWRFPASGLGKPERLTEDLATHIWSIYPSPNGRVVLFDDKRSRLWSLDLKTGKRSLIEQNESDDDDPFGGFAWSPSARYLAYASPDARSVNRLVLYDLTNGRREVVTRGKFQAFAPAFSHDGKWLFFISKRNFDPSPSNPWGDRNMGPSFDKRGLIFALELEPGARFPFAPADELTKLSSEETSDEGENEETSDESQEGGTETREIEIVFDGLVDRLWEIPVDPGSYRSLAANAEYLYVRDREDVLRSVLIDPKKPDTKEFAEDVRQFALSADGKTMFLRRGDDEDVSLALVPAVAELQENLSDHEVRIDDWRPGIDPHAEWRQMMLDAWRLHRDFAFDPNLRGVDWDSVLETYRPFLERIGHRSELDDVLGQMAAELGILHSRIDSGDLPSDEESGDAAYLGAEFLPGSDGLEVTLIYEGERDLPNTLGPLLKPDVDVRPGDILTAVDGQRIESLADLSARLQHKADQHVRLDLLRSGDTTSAIVTPVDRRAASRLLYRHWVQKNRERVAAASGGKLGYLHLRAMQRKDIASFARDFYEHFDKDGLIIDVRGNRGGNIDSWIIGTLLRRVWAFWELPQGRPPYGNMQQTFRGHLAVLINEGTYSDGETFSAGVAALDLAKLIGTRTAGAGIWLADRNELTDGGMARIAEFPQFGLDGRWLLEGRGVSPDIPVANPPRASFLGEDAQLDAAIRYLEDKIVSDPIPALKSRQLPPLGTSGEDVR